MRRYLLGAVALVAVAAFVAAQSARTSPAKRTAICHKTGSKTRPYRRIVVTTNRALKAHLAHPDDIVPAPQACPRTLLTPTSGGTAFDITLRGVSEQPDPADPDGTGTASIRLRSGQARVCFVTTVQDITPPVAGAHIHRGAVDQSGPIVVQLRAPGSGCVTVSRALVKAILADPTSYYVNVHTTDFPAGAIRGQLRMPSTALLLHADLAGANERPAPADTSGSGAANFLFLPAASRVCFTLAAKSVQLPAIASHIHRGGADVAGPIVVPLAPAPAANGLSAGCTTADPTLLQDIVANPANYYANVHTRQFPGGAIRGQLAPAA
jgi:CHRD domain